MSIEKEIELINSMLEAAVEHGGDSGGAYFCNDEHLYKAIKDWMKEKEIEEDYKIINKECEEDYNRGYVDDEYMKIHKGLETPKIVHKDSPIPGAKIYMTF